MDPITLALAAGGALVLLRGMSNSSGSTPAQQPPNTNAQSTSLIPASQASAQQEIAQVLGAVPVIGSAVANAVQAGASIDAAINPNSNAFSQTAASSLLGASTAIALLAPILIACGIAGAIVWPAVGIFLAVAVLTYAIIVLVEDIIRLTYGQAGARKDFVKQFNKIFSNMSQQLQANANVVLTQVQVERELQPFTEGFMGRLNWSSWQSIALKNGIVISGLLSQIQPSGGILGLNSAGIVNLPNVGQSVPGSNVVLTDQLLWNINWYLDRGYLIGSAPNMRNFTNPPEFNIVPQNGEGIATAPYAWQLSMQNIWVQQHAPPSDIVTQTVPDAILSAPLLPTVVAGFAAVGQTAQTNQDQSVSNGQILNNGFVLKSGNGQYKLVMQTDGNLVVYGPKSATWASGTKAIVSGGNFAQFTSGNLTVYNSFKQPLWSSHTSQSGGSKLVMQSDGNLVIYRPDGSAVWSTNTAGKQ